MFTAFRCAINGRLLWFLAFLSVACPGVVQAAPEWMKKPHVMTYPGSVKIEYLGQDGKHPDRYNVNFNGKLFTIFDGAIGPDYHSAQLLEHGAILEGEHVLEIGTGVGVQAIFAAEKAARVVATDIDPVAVDSARFNAEKHGVAHKIDFRQGDLFAPIKDTEKFDVIIFNVAYPYDRKSQKLWHLHHRFFKDVSKYLKPNGRIYYQAGLLDNIPQIKTLTEMNGLLIMWLSMYTAMEYSRQPMLFLVQPDPSLLQRE